MSVWLWEEIQTLLRWRDDTLNCITLEPKERAAVVAIHFMHYNFARIHKSLRITPAMAAGVSDHVWDLAEIADLAK